jgi:polysaccharide biosynthesis PFTS motif protein
MKILISFVRNFLNFSTEPPEILSINRVRNVLRGYRKLKASDDIGLVNRIIEQITEQELTSDYSIPSASVFTGNTRIINRAYSQFLLINLVGTRLHAKILCHLATGKPVIVPLPLKWIKVLESNNIKVARIPSLLFFLCFVLKRFFFGIVQILSFLTQNFISVVRPKAKVGGPYIYFEGLSKDCLPPSEGLINYNIVEWYLSWNGRDKDVTYICHNVAVPDYQHKGLHIQYMNTLQMSGNPVHFLIFFSQSILQILFASINLLLGQFRHAVLMEEIMKAVLVGKVPSTAVGKQYLFNNLNIVYRPLWTYAVEEKGAKVIYYNWAASFSDFLSQQGYKRTDLGEKLMSYPVVLQWSKDYAEYLRTVFSPDWSKTEVVSPIYFNDRGECPVTDGRPVIVVFDVTPQRKFFHDILVPFVEYRTYDNGRRFLEDIHNIAKEEGCTIVWKAKRSFTSHHSKAYIKFAKKFIQRDGIIAADPGTSAFRLVQRADLVISMPFTSTSLIGDHYGVPSAYYDPTGILFKNDRGRNGLELLTGKEELRVWVRKSLKYKEVRKKNI